MVAAIYISRHMHTTEILFIGIGIGLIVGLVIGFITGGHEELPEDTTQQIPSERKPRLPLEKIISAACAAGECELCIDKGCNHCDHLGSYIHRKQHQRETVPAEEELPEEPPY